jgi:hypothetical protein
MRVNTSKRKKLEQKKRKNQEFVLLLASLHQELNKNIFMCDDIHNNDAII